MGFVKSEANSNIYHLMVGGELLILVLYVNDLFFTGSSGLIEDCKRNLVVEFEMKDLGLMHYFLGLEVWQMDREIFLAEGRYTKEILKRFKMQNCRSMSMPMITHWRKIDALEDANMDPTLYRQRITSIMYLVNTRPDICFTVNPLSQFMVEPKRVHWTSVVQWAEKAPQGVATILDQGLSLDAVGSRSPWHSILQRKNTWQLAWLHAKLFVFESC
eukprot:PITA_27528